MPVIDSPPTRWIEERIWFVFFISRTSDSCSQFELVGMSSILVVILSVTVFSFPTAPLSNESIHYELVQSLQTNQDARMPTVSVSMELLFEKSILTKLRRLIRTPNPPALTHHSEKTRPRLINLEFVWPLSIGFLKNLSTHRSLVSETCCATGCRLQACKFLFTLL